MLILYVFMMPSWIGQIISYSLALIVNFIILKSWAFKSTVDERASRQFIKYLVLVAFNLPISTILIHQLTVVGMPGYLSKVLIIALIAIWNYIFYDRLIFKSSK